MALLYKAVQSAKETKDGKKLWHINLVKSKKVVTTNELGELIAEKSMATPGDVHDVVRNLMSVMREQLLNSRTVRLEGLGTFTMRARSTSKGVETADKVSPQQITTLWCQFTPEYRRPATGGGVTRAMLNGVSFENVANLGGGSSNVGGSGNTGGGGNEGGGSDGDQGENPLG